MMNNTLYKMDNIIDKMGIYLDFGKDNSTSEKKYLDLILFQKH